MNDLSYTNQLAGQPNNKKSSSPIKNIITILLLIITPPIGVLVMWVFTNWSRKVKIIITAIWILSLLIAVILVSLPSPGTQQIVKEARVESRMRSLLLDLEIFSAKEDRSSTVNCETNENFMFACKDLKEETGFEPVMQMASDVFAKYCAYVQVSSTEYYCFDSSSAWREKTTTFPGGTGYCTESSFKCPEVQL